jgi:diguanylate cyclase (GGDEF)-like protein
VAVGALFVLGIAAISLKRLDSSYFFVEHLGLIAVVAETVLLALVLAHQIAVADTERYVALDRAAHHARIALTDALTGLANRYALDRDLPKLPADGSLSFIDLDSLKRYNDEYGHERGDDLLCGFARHLTEALEGRAKAYRLAGDEFAVTCAAGEVVFVSDAVTRAIGALRARGFEFAGASCGSVRRSETESLDQLKRVADSRMYQQKTARKSLGPQPPGQPPESWRSPRQ